VPAGPLQFRSPPGWPAPPPGWVPPPGWAPNPAWPAAPAGWQFYEAAPQRPFWALDDAVRATHDVAGEQWGWRVATWPIIALVIVLVLDHVAAHFWSPSGFAGLIAAAVLSFGFYGVLIVAGIESARHVAAHGGGWSAAFGISKPRWLDLAVGAGASIAEYIARIVAALILVLALPSLRNAHASNLDVTGLSVPALVLTGILVVFVAPPVEEFIFRALILRTLMTRMSFWPAAMLSSVVFALFHAPAVDTVDGAVVLVSSIFVFALGQCLLVRWSSRLAPAMVAHGVGNAIAFALALAISR
jgi:membrane protease YdiL (CAAX protease family)